MKDAKREISRLLLLIAKEIGKREREYGKKTGGERLLHAHVISISDSTHGMLSSHSPCHETSLRPLERLADSRRSATIGKSRCNRIPRGAMMSRKGAFCLEMHKSATCIHSPPVDHFMLPIVELLVMLVPTRVLDDDDASPFSPRVARPPPPFSGRRKVVKR